MGRAVGFLGARLRDSASWCVDAFFVERRLDARSRVVDAGAARRVVEGRAPADHARCGSSDAATYVDAGRALRRARSPSDSGRDARPAVSRPEWTHAVPVDPPV